MGGLKALNIPSSSTATTLTLLLSEPTAAETDEETPTAAAASALVAAAHHPKGKAESRVLSALRRLRRLWGYAQKLGMTFTTSLADFTANRGLQPRTPTLREKTNHPTSSPPPPSPPPPPLLSPPLPPLLNTPSPLPLLLSPLSPPTIVLSSTFDTQAELDDGALKDIEPGPSGRGKEKADIYDEHKGDGREGDRTAKDATGVTGIQDSFKRTADSAGLNEGGEVISRLEKVRRTGQSPDPSRCGLRLMTFERPHG